MTAFLVVLTAMGTADVIVVGLAVSTAQWWGLVFLPHALLCCWLAADAEKRVEP